MRAGKDTIRATDKVKRTTINIPLWLRERIEALSEKEDRTLSNQIIVLIQDGIAARKRRRVTTR